MHTLQAIAATPLPNTCVYKTILILLFLCKCFLPPQTVAVPPQSSIVVQALRLTLAVPATVETGQNVTLVCDHDPEGDELYAVKWYRQRTLGETRGREFVRYTPKEIPAVKYFPLHGITVDVSVFHNL